MMSELKTLPPQQLPFSRKTKEWRKRHLDWADTRNFLNYSLVRKSVLHKKINYDLVNGKLNMKDMDAVLNPDNIQAGYMPDRVQHYPIINSKLNVLRGEEAKRVFDFRVIVTNPNAISESENNKKEAIFQDLQNLISNSSQSEEDYNAALEKLNSTYTYEWQDIKEIRGNTLMNHYIKEYNIPLIFNHGFMDALTVGEEMYMCDIVGGEPTIEKLNPLKVRIFKSGYSSKIEDADIIVIEDYWSPSKVIDTYYDVLSDTDIKYIDNLPTFESSNKDDMHNYDERDNFIMTSEVGVEQGDSVFFDPLSLFGDSNMGSHLYYDRAGNVRVLKVYWKSRRKIKKIKSYDETTGEEVYNFYPESYILDEANGEEEQTFWINEAWEGVKIGREIYVNMKPKVVQYNRMSNPSRCHFGIIGSIYNLNDSRPFSLVDMMKSYNYLYNAIHDRLNKAIASNWGKIMELDLAQVPKGWDIDKWMYFAKVNHIAVKDSFNEGNIGAATGKLAGGFAANNRGVIDAETGNYIQQHINLLEFIKMEMSEVAGISKQREGQISNRETVGGVERATLQSSHITEWLFQIHDDIKKRVLECFLETAKIALKGKSKKFQYILSDMSIKVTDIEGDEFAEADYGLVVDNSRGVQELNSKLDMLAQAALQNQSLSFSTIMKLYNSNSISEKQKMIDKDEQSIQERNSQAAQQQQESQERLVQMQLEMKQSELSLKDQINIRDNETKILIASMSQSDKAEEDSLLNNEDLLEKKREFDAKLSLDKEKLKLDEKKHKDTISLKRSIQNSK